MKNLSRIYIAFLLVALVFAARFLPHLPNASPVLALCLLSTRLFKSTSMAFGSILVAMILSDFILGFHPVMFWVYGSLALICLLSRFRLNIFISGFLSSILFFIVSNFGHWLTTAMYSKTWAGLVACYTAAIPFLKYSLIGDFVYIAVIFGTLSFLQKRKAMTLTTMD